MRTRAIPALSAAALALIIGVLGTPALASHPVASLDFACASEADGELRYVTDVAACDATTEVAIAIRPGPTEICLEPDGTVAPPPPDDTELPDTALPVPPGFQAPPRAYFDTPLVTPGGCEAGQTALVLPSATDAYFCASESTGVLRYVTDPAECTSSETELVAANHAPSDMALSSSSVAENEPAGTPVGTLTATDPDLAESFTFALVSGPGDDDNAAFAIDGTTLVTAATLDAEVAALDVASLLSEFATAGFDTTGVGSLSIRVRATDLVGASLEESFTITVTDVNEAPTDITLTPSSIVEDQPIGSTVGTLVAVDEDIGQTHTFAFAAGAGDTDNASFAIVGDQLQTAVALNDPGTFSVRITTDDGAGGTFTRALTITVTDANDPPTDLALSNTTVAENQPAGTAIGTLSATDPDLPPQTFSFGLAATGCGGGPFADNVAFDVVGDELRTATSLDFEAQASYTICVRVTDSGTPALSRDEQFTITLTNVNDPPSFMLPADPNQTVLEDGGPETVSAFATAISAGGELGQTLTFTVTADSPTLFSVQPAIDETTGDLTYSSAPDANGTTTVSVTLSDDGGGTDTSPIQTFDITITPVNDSPSFSLPASPDHTIPQDAGPQMVLGFATAISAGPANESGQALTFGLTTTNDALFTTLPAIDETTGDLTYEAAAGTSGSATVSVVLTDDGGTANGGDDTSATQTFDITVTPPNAVPVAVGAMVSTDEDTPLVITLAATDTGDDPLTFAIVDGPAQGSLGPIGAPDCAAIETCTASVTYTPDPNTNGADAFTFIANDGVQDSNVATISITINPVNDAPVLTLSGSTPSYTENGSPVTVDGGLTVTDIDSADLVSGSVTISAGSVAGDTLTFTPAGGISDTDAALDVLALSGTTSIATWETVLRSVQFSSTSDNPTNATRTVSFTVDDAGLTSNTAQKSVAVVPVNDAPVVTAGGTLAYTENQAATAIDPTVSVTDVDSPNLTGATIQLTSGCTNPQDVLSYVTALGISVQSYDAATCLLTLTGTTTVANYQTALRNVLYANSSEDPSTASRTVTWTVTDGTATSAGATSTITVTPVNDAPMAGDLTFSGANAAIGNTALVINDASDGAPDPTGVQKTVAGDLFAAGTDVDTASALWSITATTVTNAAGALTIEADGDLTYHPVAGFSGNAVFTYTLNDNDPDGNATDTGTITINVPAPLIWYVDNSAAADGDGTSDGPFDALVDVSPAGPDAAGDIIYLFSGGGDYTGGITLLNTQTLHGAGTALTVSGTTLAPAGTDPTITNAAGNGVTLGSGNTLTGFTVGNTIAFDIANTATATVGTLTVSNVVLNGSGSLFRADSGGALAVTLESATTSAAGASGIVIAGGATGSFTVSGATTVNDATADGIAISNSAANATFTGLVTILNDGVGANGDGVDLSTNTGTYAFSDGVSITVNGVGAFGLRAQSSGTVTIADPGGTNQITSNAGTALLINPTGLTATLAAVTSSGGSEGISLSGMSGALTIGSVDIDGQSGDGIDITSSTGSVAINGGSIGATNDPAGIGVDINGGAGNVTIGATITKTTAGDVVEVSGHTGGTVDFNGAITSNTAGGGIDLTGNTGATIRFDGGMALSTGTARAFNATGGGTIAVTDVNGATAPNNTLTTGTGIALNVESTTIHADDLTFLSISANGGTNGIVLSSTGSSGGLTVTGTGTTDGSGGTIQSTTTRGASIVSAVQISLSNINFTNAATGDFPAAPTGLSLGVNTADNAVIHLQAVTGVSLANLNLTGSAEHGINIHNVNTLSLTDSVLLNLGNGPDEDGIHAFNLSGTSSITNTTITSSGDDNVNIQNNTIIAPISSVATINVSGGSFNTGVLGSGLLFGIRGTSNATINISAVTINNNFSGGVVADNFDTATMNVEVSGSTITNNNDAVAVSSDDGSGLFDIHDNTMAGQDFVNVSVLLAADPVAPVLGGTLQGFIRNNDITVANGRPADAIIVFAAGQGTLTTAITGNTIDYGGTQRAIAAQAGQDGVGSLNLTITGNAIDIQLDGTGNAVTGIFAQTAVASPSGDGSPMCANIGGAGVQNVFTHSLGGNMAGGEIRIRQRFVTTVSLPGYAGANSDNAAVVSYLAARNTLVNSPAATATNEVGVTVGAGGFVNTASCTQPAVP